TVQHLAWHAPRTAELPLSIRVCVEILFETQPSGTVQRQNMVMLTINDSHSRIKWKRRSLSSTWAVSVCNCGKEKASNYSALHVKFPPEFPLEFIWPCLSQPNIALNIKETREY
ncbi:hypothetical protein PAXRUDRAFT_776650, partial [Paxillus rubicundulus Ve08.2h10]